MIHGLTQCGWMLRRTPPDPAFRPYCASVGISSSPGSSAPAGEGRPASIAVPREPPATGGLNHAHAANGSSERPRHMDLHQPTRPPRPSRQRRPAAAGSRRLKRRQHLEEPRKKSDRRREDVRRVDEVRGELNRPRNGEEPSPDQPARCAGRQFAARTTRARRSPRTTAGSAERTATRDRQRPATAGRRASACSAPGISLRVQTTSGPKKGHSPVA